MSDDGSKYRAALLGRIREMHLYHCDYCKKCKQCHELWPCDMKRLYDLFHGMSIRNFYMRNEAETEKWFKEE